VERVSDLAAADWARVIAANLTGAFLVAKHGLPVLAQEGSLTFVGAVSERLQLPGMAAYAASKAALDTFAVTLAKEERKHKVSVLRPGAVDTPFWNKLSLRLPKNAVSADAVAQRIVTIISNKESGIIDL
jgi:NAD(P)-dependent dehydrogenase (short-subunit alcohol dehydrogenase family)